MVPKLYFSSEAIFTVRIFKCIPLPSTLLLSVAMDCYMQKVALPGGEGGTLEQEEKKCSHLLLHFLK